MSFAIRDDYTSLMWLGGTKALFSLGDGGENLERLLISKPQP